MKGSELGIPCNLQGRSLNSITSGGLWWFDGAKCRQIKPSTAQIGGKVQYCLTQAELGQQITGGAGSTRSRS